MTTTFDRWWAADAQVPLDALLTPGGDGKKDLAQGLFALHRAGAEACELVAKTAVADEAVLIAALAENRLHVVPQALDVVAKGVSTPQYAGLLVRDLLDDAESAALALYRTCLAKSVPPPVAAQRVGLVYGVPGRELGRYATVAADPSAKEVAVRDAADRALFGFVSKVVEAEYDEAKVEFSKDTALLTRPQQSEYLDEHNVQNGPDGKFVAEGRGTSRLARLKRAARAQRATRALEASKPQTKIAPVQVKATAKVSAKSAPVKVQSAIRQEKARVMMSATARQLQAAAVVPVDDTPPPKHKPMGEGVSGLDMIGERHDPNAGEHHDLNQSLGFVLPTSKWQPMAQAMAEGTEVGKPVLVAGALEEYIGQPERFHEEVDDDGNVVVSEDHEFQVSHAMEMAKSAPEMQGRPELWVRRLESGLTRGMSPEAVRGMLQEEAQDLIAEYRMETGASVSYAAEAGHISFVPAYDDPEALVVVYNPPDEDGPAFGKREVPAITEVVISEGAARGIDLGRGRHTDFVLDKDQALQIEDRSHFFDTARGVFRSRVTLTAADHDLIDQARRRRFGKADTAVLERQSEYLDLHNIENDPATGRFVPERGGRAQRLQRARRAQRAQRSLAAAPKAEPAQVAAVRPTGVVASVQASAARMQVRSDARATVRRVGLAVDEAGAGEDELLPQLQLDPKAKYTLIDAQTMGLMAADDGFANPEMAQNPWHLSWRNAVGLGKPVDAEDAMVSLLTAQLPEDLVNARNRPSSETREVKGGRRAIKSKGDLEALAGLVHDELDTSEGQRVLIAHAYQTGGDVTIELTVADRDTPPIYLVKRETRADLDVQLTPIGANRALGSGQIMDFLVSAYEGAKKGGSNTRFLHNPLVITYRLEDVD